MVLVRDGCGIRDTEVKKKNKKKKDTHVNEEEIEEKEDEVTDDANGEEEDDDGTGEEEDDGTGEEEDDGTGEEEDDDGTGEEEDDEGTGEKEDDDGAGEGKETSKEEEDTSEDISDDDADKGDVEKGDKDKEDMNKDITDDDSDKVEVEKGDKDEDSQGKSIQIQQDIPDDDSSDEEEDSRPLQPEKMYFDPSEYTKSVRIGTRCNVQQTVEFLEQFPAELKWLRENEQFKHVFHMPMERNHQVQGMWMLMLRTTCTEAEGECWFLVNGIPIRYSIREHALLTGFNCKEYPANWKKLGGLEFAQRVFKKTKGIKIGAVENKLESMKTKRTSEDRMKLAVLYFLCKVLKAKNKYEPTVDEFLLKIVNNLSVCETFPWGRYTFNDCIDGIKGLVKKMKGVVKTNAQPGFSGFIIPPEILAFECIEDLGKKFREDVPADAGCPRMCKRKFVHENSKGPSLDDINAALGDTKVISSILQPTLGERELLRRNVEDYVDDGMGLIDPIVESWRERLLVQGKKIFWKGWFKKDVEARAPTMIEGVDEKENPVEQLVENPEMTNNVFAKLSVLETKVQYLIGALGEMTDNVFAKLSVLETKVQFLSEWVAGQRMDVRDEGGSPDLIFPSEEKNDKEKEEDKEDGGKGNEKEHDGDENVEAAEDREKDTEEKEDGDENEKDKEEKNQEKTEKKRKDREETKKSKVNNDAVMETRAKRLKKAPNRYTPGDQKKHKK